MPVFPEQIYVPSAADAQKGIVLPQRYVMRNRSAGIFQTAVCTSPPVPPDRVLIVQHAFLFANVAAPEGLLTLNLVLSDEVGNTTVILDDVRARAAAVFPATGIVGWVFNLSAPICVMPSERIRAIAVYSGGAVNKETTLDLVGVMYPRGNWQYAPA